MSSELGDIKFVVFFLHVNYLDYYIDENCENAEIYFILNI